MSEWCIGRNFWINLLRNILVSHFDLNSWTNVCESCSATWNLLATSTFALGLRRTTGNRVQGGRSQDLPDADWLVAKNHSLNRTTLTLVHIWLLLYLKKLQSLISLIAFKDQISTSHNIFCITIRKKNRVMCFEV
jgi:hypothetical protein